MKKLKELLIKFKEFPLIKNNNVLTKEIDIILKDADERIAKWRKQGNRVGLIISLIANVIQVFI